MTEPRYSDLATAITAAGLAPRGGFHCEAADVVPDLPGGRPAKTQVMAGNLGSSLWPTFRAAPEGTDGALDPMNRWSARVIGEIAAGFGAMALFPFGDAPYLPFQRWAQRAEPVAPSPLGMLIHPRYGLWHAYRGALAFADRIDLPPRETLTSPCDTCVSRPCLSACPVGAFASGSYDVGGCAAHISAPAGRDCLEAGCQARRACPVGRDYLYETEQSGFHMRAFLAARGRRTEET